MAMKRVRNANNANGAIEFLDDGTVQVSDKSDRTKKLVLDASQVPTGGSVSIASGQQVQDSIADKPSYRMNDSSLIDISANMALAIGSSPFCEVVQFKATSVIQAIAYGGQICNLRMDSSNYFLVGARANAGADQGKLQAIINDTATITNAQLLDDKPHTIVSMRDASNNLSFYVDGVLATIISGPTTSGVAFATATRFKIGEIIAGYNALGHIYRAMLFNYALSEAKLRRYSAGAKLDYEDVGGSMNKLTAAWVTPANSYGYSYNGGSFSSTGPTSYTGVITTGSGYAEQTFPLVVGKRYRITLTVNTSVTVSIKDSITNTLATKSLTSGVADYIDFTAASNVSSFYVVIAASVAVTGIKLDQLGAVLDLEPENITDTMWVDASPNGLHGVVSGALANRFVPQYSSRNYIINGAMEIDQRHAGASYTSTLVPMLTTDRWKLYSGYPSTLPTVQQVTDAPSGLSNSLSISSLPGINAYTGTTGLWLYQEVEGFTLTPLAPGTAGAKTITLSFWAKTTATGVMSIFLQDGASAVSYISPVVISVAGVWQFYSVTLRLPTSGGTWNLGTVNLGMKVGFNLGISPTWIVTPNANVWQAANLTGLITQTNFLAAANSSVKITGVMLNEGSYAAPFERAEGTIAGELALCQRYYELVVPPSTAASADVGVGIVVGTGIRVSLPFKTEKRTEAFTLVSSAYSVFEALGTGTITLSAIAAPAIGQSKCTLGISFTQTGGADRTAAYLRKSNTPSAFIAVDAEF